MIQVDVRVPCDILAGLRSTDNRAVAIRSFVLFVCANGLIRLYGAALVYLTW